MSILTDTVVQHALTPSQVADRDAIVLSADDIRAAWRLALNPRLSNAGLRSYGDDLAAFDHFRAAATYSRALGIRAQAVASATSDVHGPWPLPLAGCDWCGEWACVATTRVFCDAEHGGEVFVGDGCTDAAAEHMEVHAIGRGSKVRTDPMDSDDHQRIALRQATQETAVAAA